jgi:hypothetical protein
LRARKNDGCEQKDYRKNSLEQAGSLSQFSILEIGCILCFVVAISFVLICEYRDVTPMTLFRGMIALSDERFAMLYSALKALAGILSICSISAGAFSQCSVDVVVVKGRVENAPSKGIVRVQLVYPKQKQEMGESGDVTVEGGAFRIQIPFLTQSRAPGLLGIREKCDRKPKTVVVTLLKAGQERDHEYDRVSLDLAKDFKMADPSAYALRSEILLYGPPSTPPIR